MTSLANSGAVKIGCIIAENADATKHKAAGSGIILVLLISTPWLKQLQYHSVTAENPGFTHFGQG
jgi:hypothetical protein